MGSMNFIDKIKERAKSNKKKIVLPETMDKRVIEAAEKILKEELAEVVLIGRNEDISKIAEGHDISKAIIVDPFSAEYTEELINELGLNGQKRVQSYYGYEKMLKNYEKSYEEAIRKWQE